MASLEKTATRRRFLTVSALFGVSVLAAACGTAPTPTPAPAAPKPTEAPAKAAAAPTSAPAAAAPTPTTAAPAKATTPPPTVKTTLNVFLPFSPKHKLEFDLMTGEYVKSNPHVEFAPIVYGTGQQDFIEVFLARIAAGQAPDVAVLHDSPVSLAVRGALEPLDDLMKTSRYSAKENWPGTLMASTELRGKYYGFPTMIAVYGMYYNQEMFEKAGLKSNPEDYPKTWDDLRKASKQFTKWEGDRLATAGFIPTWDQQGAEMVPVWLGLNGGKIYDAASQKYSMDAEANVAAFDYAISWLNEEYKGDIDKVKKSGSWSFGAPQGQQPAFQAARLATLMGGNFNVLMYNEVKPTFERWNVASFPVGPNGKNTVSGYWPNWFVIPKGAKNKTEGFNWVDWINGDGIRYWYKTVPDMPTNKNFPRDLLPEILVQHRGKDFAQAFVQFFYKQMDLSIEMWNSPVQGFSTDQITRAVERIYKKADSPKNALAEAQKACQTELEKVLSRA